jgi:hypothetical protein
MKAFACAAESRHQLLSPVTRFALVALLVVAFAFGTLAPVRAAASNIQFVGNVGYTAVGDVAVLTAAEVGNVSPSGFSGGRVTAIRPEF